MQKTCIRDIYRRPAFQIQQHLHGTRTFFHYCLLADAVMQICEISSLNSERRPLSGWHMTRWIIAWIRLHTYLFIWTWTYPQMLARLRS